MPRFDIEIKPFGNQAILIEWPNKINDLVLADIMQFTSLVLKKKKSELINYTPGYNSLLLQYISLIDFDSKKQSLLNTYKSRKGENIHVSNSWHIPVCYEEEFGMDLSLFVEKGLSKEEVIDLHTSKPFKVYMMGFLPGFLYLGGLSPELHMNRKKNPRLHVPRGSVAIGGEQTGIYPMASPGGWQIIGRTPLSLFDLSQQNPTPIRQGDNIHFYAIDRETYQNLSSN